MQKALIRKGMLNDSSSQEKINKMLIERLMTVKSLCAFYKSKVISKMQKYTENLTKIEKNTNGRNKSSRKFQNIVRSISKKYIRLLSKNKRPRNNCVLRINEFQNCSSLDRTQSKSTYSSTLNQSFMTNNNTEINYNTSCGEYHSNLTYEKTNLVSLNDSKFVYTKHIRDTISSQQTYNIPLSLDYSISSPWAASSNPTERFSFSQQCASSINEIFLASATCKHGDELSSLELVDDSEKANQHCQDTIVHSKLLKYTPLTPPERKNDLETISIANFVSNSKEFSSTMPSSNLYDNVKKPDENYNFSVNDFTGPNWKSNCECSVTATENQSSQKSFAIEYNKITDEEAKIPLEPKNSPDADSKITGFLYQASLWEQQIFAFG